MSTTVKTGWLNDKNGDKFAPKTLTSQVQTSDGTLLEDKIQADLEAAKSYADNIVPEIITEVTSEVTDEQIPSAKAVYDYVQGNNLLVIEVEETEDSTYSLADGWTYETIKAEIDKGRVVALSSGNTMHYYSGCISVAIYFERYTQASKIQFRILANNVVTYSSWLIAPQVTEYINAYTSDSVWMCDHTYAEITELLADEMRVVLYINYTSGLRREYTYAGKLATGEHIFLYAQGTSNYQVTIAEDETVKSTYYSLTSAKRTINGHELSSNITLTADDVGAIPVPASAAVGDLVKVSAVDSSGKPTAWEAVDRLDDNNIPDTIARIEYVNEQLVDKADSEHNHTVSDVIDLTATAIELNYSSGVTSDIQTQLNNKTNNSGWTAGAYLGTNADGVIAEKTGIDIGNEIVNLFVWEKWDGVSLGEQTHIEISQLAKGTITGFDSQVTYADSFMIENGKIKLINPSDPIVVSADTSGEETMNSLIEKYVQIIRTNQSVSNYYYIPKTSTASIYTAYITGLKMDMQPLGENIEMIGYITSIAEDAYPTDAADDNGYWYVRGNKLGALAMLTPAEEASL